jgi:hypothetical protein
LSVSDEVMMIDGLKEAKSTYFIDVLRLGGLNCDHYVDGDKDIDGDRDIWGKDNRNSERVLPKGEMRAKTTQ